MMIFTSVDLVDECAGNNGGCEDICTDTDDSFVCSCSSGSTLNNDGRTCDGTLPWYTYLKSLTTKNIHKMPAVHVLIKLNVIITLLLLLGQYYFNALHPLVCFPLTTLLSLL